MPSVHPYFIPIFADEPEHEDQCPYCKQYTTDLDNHLKERCKENNNEKVN